MKIYFDQHQVGQPPKLFLEAETAAEQCQLTYVARELEERGHRYVAESATLGFKFVGIDPRFNKSKEPLNIL